MTGVKNCSLIITTYNWPAALKKCLQSITWQSQLPAEVIVADDGSNNETANMIAEMKKIFPVPLIHMWHEDSGRRKTRINNISIASARYEYLVFIDHDIIMHPDFIRDHLALAEKGYFLNGSRFLTDAPSTKAFLAKDTVTPADLKELKGKNGLNRLRVPFLMNFMAHRYQTAEKYTVDVRGCNMSFWRKDLIAVNGYDEAYMNWGREDSNIAIRLSNIGIKKKSIKFGGITYHLDHPFSSREDDAMNLRMLQDAIDRKEQWAPAGLDQYLNPETAAR